MQIREVASVYQDITKIPIEFVLYVHINVRPAIRQEIVLIVVLFQHILDNLIQVQTARVKMDTMMTVKIELVFNAFLNALLVWIIQGV